MGRWTHTFTRCPVSVAACSETKMSPNNRVARVETAIRSRDASQQEGFPTRRYLPRTQARSWFINQWMWYRLSTRQNTSSLHRSSQRVSIAGPVKADTNRTGVFRSFTKTLYASSTSPLRKREKDALETLLSFEHIFSSPTRFQRTLYASSTSPPLEELGGLYGKDTSHLRDILRTNLCTRA